MVRAEIIYLWLSVDRKSSYSRAMDYPKIVTSTAVKWQMRRTQYVFWGKAVSSRTRQGQPGMCYERVLLIMISSGLNNYGYASHTDSLLLPRLGSAAVVRLIIVIITNEKDSRALSCNGRNATKHWAGWHFILHFCSFSSVELLACSLVATSFFFWIMEKSPIVDFQHECNDTIQVHFVSHF